MEEHQSYWICGADIIHISEDWDIESRSILAKTDSEIRDTILWSNHFAQCAVLIRKEVLSKSGLFNTDLFLAEDYDLFLRIWLYSKMANIDCLWLAYRNRKDSTSNRNAFTLKLSTLQVSLQYRKYYPNRSIWLAAQILPLFLSKNTIKRLIRMKNCFIKKYKF